MPITHTMTHALSRPARRGALVLGSLALAVGTLAPAAGASAAGTTPTSAAPAPVTVPATVPAPAADRVTSGIAAKKKATKKARTKAKPARVGRPKLVKGGSRHLNVRISWPWVSGVSHYIVQAGLTKKFTKPGRVKARRSNPRSRPAGGRLELTLPGLANATRYQVRVRAVAKNGAKGPWSKPRKVKTKVHIPERITSMTATPGPGPGQVTFAWTHKPTYTTFLELQLASTTFHPQGKNLPKKGRNHLTIKIPATQRSTGSYTISAAQAARAGVRVGSGGHLYYRFSAVNKGTAGKKVRLLPNLHGVKPEGPSMSRSGDDVKAVIGTFNLASNKADGGRDFEARVGAVADLVVAKRLGIVGLQELSPGKKGERTTDLLESTLRSRAPNQGYRLVRSTPYVKPGTANVGSQGARILYDSTRYELMLNASPCADTSQDGDYSGSCVIEMDPAPGEVVGRMAAYAQFLDTRTKARFWFVSLHLTPDGSMRPAEGDRLRARQVRTVLAKIDALNTEGLPVIVTGDLNSWHTRAGGNVAQDAFLDAGFLDTFATAKTVNEDYSTLNNWATTMRQYPQGYGVRLDYVLVRGGVGATQWENVMKVTDSARPSDHNLVVTEVLMPAPR